MKVRFALMIALASLVTAPAPAQPAPTDEAPAVEQPMGFQPDTAMASNEVHAPAQPTAEAASPAPATPKRRTARVTTCRCGADPVTR